MPLIEVIVKEHLGFVYSQTLGIYVSCGFFNRFAGMYPNGREVKVCFQISFNDVKSIVGIVSQHLIHDSAAVLDSRRGVCVSTRRICTPEINATLDCCTLSS